MGVKFTNNAQGALAAPITDAATSLTLGAGEGNLFPAVASGATDYFYITLTDVAGNREIVKCQLRTAGSNVLAELVRAQDGTAAIAFDTADVVDLRIPAVVLTEWETESEANAAAIISTDADVAALDARVVLIETGVEDSGNKMYFYQAAAPTAGWVIDATVEDVLLAVVDQAGGGLGYDIAAGNPGGSWTATTHTHTGPSHTHTGPSHTHTFTGDGHVHTTAGHALSVAEMPAHSHGPGVGTDFIVLGAAGLGQAGNAYGPSPTTASAGSSSSHSHGNTGSGTSNGTVDADGTAATGASGTAATGAGSQPSTDRPRAAVGIICTKS